MEDMENSQLEMKNEVREVQGVSLDVDKRELQRLARDSADYYFRDKLEASDASFFFFFPFFHFFLFSFFGLFPLFHSLSLFFTMFHYFSLFLHLFHSF